MSYPAKSNEFHNRAKAEGDKLKAYVFSLAAAGTGLFFATLCTGTLSLSPAEQAFLLAGLLFFAITVIICLVELHINSRRFFSGAKTHEQEEPDWSRYEKLSTVRLKLIYTAYGTLATAVIATVLYLVLRIT